jgi:hypothetical protein
MGRMLRARSHLELRLMEICEVDSAVAFYVEQPIRLTYRDPSGALRRHTPDLFFEGEGHHHFVEVKWESDARLPRNELRWPGIGEAIASLGCSYEVLTERHIFLEPRAANVRDLLRAKRSEPLPSDKLQPLYARLWSAPLTLAEIEAEWPSLAGRPILRLISEGHLSADLHQRLGPSSKISICSSANSRE